MARSKRKQAASARKRSKPRPSLDPLRAGMPALDSIVGVEEFKKGKSVLHIIHTNEVDAYDQASSRDKRKKR